MSEHETEERVRCETHRSRLSAGRRVDLYGFERYEDARRDWYLLSGEEEASRYVTHDREREELCSRELLALIFKLRTRKEEPG